MKSLHSFLHIPTPCHENWDVMSEAEQGRYCNACAKTVIDFSLMSNEEILQYLNTNSTQVCGRFANSQLKPQATLSHKLKVFLYALCTVFLLQVGEGVSAQSSIDTITALTKKGFTVSGRIVDEKNNPLDFATIFISQDGVLKGATKSDLNGEFYFKDLPTGLYELKVYYLPMETKIIRKIQLNKSLRFDISMKLDPNWRKKKHIVGLINYSRPLVDPSNPGQQIMTNQDLRKLPIH